MRGALGVLGVSEGPWVFLWGTVGNWEQGIPGGGSVGGSLGISVGLGSR